MSTSEAEPLTGILTPDQRRFLLMVFKHFSGTSEWPVISRLQKDLVRKGEKLELEPLADQIPRKLGYRIMSGSANSFQLTIRGAIALVPQSQEVADFETAIGLCREFYLADEGPQLTSTLLQEQHGIDGLRLKKLQVLLQTDPLFTLDGGTQADGSWSRVVWDRWAHRFAEARTAADYVAACDQIEAQAATPPRPTLPPVRRRLGRSVQLRAPEPLDLVAVVDGLHPRIRDACHRLVADDHLPSAVNKASIALADLLRERSGLHHLDGDQLAGAALSPNNGNPLIAVADLNTKDGLNFQRGTQLLAQGIFASIRNVVAHKDVEFSPAEALEMLGTISLIARRIAPAEDKPES